MVANIPYLYCCVLSAGFMFLSQPSNILTSLLPQILLPNHLFIESLTLPLQCLGLFLNCCRRSFEGLDRVSEVVFEDRPCRAKIWVIQDGLECTRAVQLGVTGSEISECLQLRTVDAYSASSSLESNVSGRRYVEAHSAFRGSSKADKITSRLCGMSRSLRIDRTGVFIIVVLMRRYRKSEVELGVRLLSTVMDLYIRPLLYPPSNWPIGRL